MTPVSGTNTNAAQPLTAAENTTAPPKTQQPEEETHSRPLKPAMDEYVPSEKPEPSGRYQPGRDEDGQPRVYFDDPEKDGKEESRCTCNTDRVDRKIEKLRKNKKVLEQRLNTETDETKVKALKKQLAQIKQELREKDNDSYRRCHADFS